MFWVLSRVRETRTQTRPRLYNLDRNTLMGKVPHQMQREGGAGYASPDDEDFRNRGWPH